MSAFCFRRWWLWLGLLMIAVLTGCEGVGYYGGTAGYGGYYDDYYGPTYGPAYYGGIWGPDVYVYGHQHHHDYDDFGRRGWASRNAGHAYHGGGLHGGYHGYRGSHGGGYRGGHQR